MLKWYADFMRHPEFTNKVRKMANNKSFNMLPTFTEDLGPRQKMSQADVACDSDEAKELEFLILTCLPSSHPPVDLNNVENRNNNRETCLSDASGQDEDIVHNMYMV